MLASAQGVMRRRVAAAGAEQVLVTDSVLTDAEDAWGIYSTGLEYWNEGGGGTKWVGYWNGEQETQAFIFQLDIPQGSTIDTALITYWANFPGSLASGDEVTWIGYNVDNVADFTDTGDHTVRAHAANTTATVTEDAPHAVSGTPTSWTSANLKTIVEEIVARGSWSSGNQLGIFMDWNTGAANHDHSAYDSNNGSYYPHIRVVYH